MRFLTFAIASLGEGEPSSPIPDRGLSARKALHMLAEMWRVRSVGYKRVLRSTPTLPRNINLASSSLVLGGGLIQSPFLCRARQSMRNLAHPCTLDQSKRFLCPKFDIEMNMHFENCSFRC